MGQRTKWPFVSQRWRTRGRSSPSGTYRAPIHLARAASKRTVGLNPRLKGWHDPRSSARLRRAASRSPWDDTNAIREMLFSVERLEEHAGAWRPPKG
jgi:hypothetical protein